MFDIFDMGGHELYVWLAYGVSLGACLLLAIIPMVSNFRSKARGRGVGVDPEHHE